MSVALSYRLISNNLDRQLEITAKQGSVKLESEYYLENYQSVGSIDEFLENTRLFTTAMKAFGLEEMAFAKGYMRKILEEGMSDPRSLGNRTTDPRIQEFARAFDFESFGDLTMKRTATGQAVVDKFVRQQLEETAGVLDGEGVRLALYFERMAGDINSAYDILADKAMSKVVRTALGLPAAFSGADIDKQAAVIKERLDGIDFTDPQALQQFLTRFTALWDATENVASDPILTLFAGGGSSMPTISLDLAMSLSSLRLGGA
ncbi:DUF1217 domain-containing protein [Acuticoccus sp. I52.16.1]|uniref:DUF1217 domain-containing protein n=1 Tax=Acuticoccus sp. I52.16.1 TaxID=2928472 RepID=UPI001FCFD317|nr:DUF1217 domain-containing protein [Acuticoccus sp. I52.16.1]UOM34332.1 DUF1217 domain-containing protein [Acuticoccus sp. I52.16.1]